MVFTQFIVHSRLPKTPVKPAIKTAKCNFKNTFHIKNYSCGFSILRRAEAPFLDKVL